jgi:hypothetical protein
MKLIAREADRRQVEGSASGKRMLGHASSLPEVADEAIGHTLAGVYVSK